jgi:hypothetical protein
MIRSLKLRFIDELDLSHWQKSHRVDDVFIVGGFSSSAKFLYSDSCVAARPSCWSFADFGTSATNQLGEIFNFLAVKKMIPRPIAPTSNQPKIFDDPLLGMMLGAVDE